jgi:hypothetical protein
MLNVHTGHGVWGYVTWMVRVFVAVAAMGGYM